MAAPAPHTPPAAPSPLALDMVGRGLLPPSSLFWRQRDAGDTAKLFR